MVELLAEETRKRKKKRGQYHQYSIKLRAKVVKYGCEKGDQTAIQEYSAGYTIPEATASNFQSSCLRCIYSPFMLRVSQEVRVGLEYASITISISFSAISTSGIMYLLAYTCTKHL